MHSGSQTPAVNVRIYYANQTTLRLWEQVFLIWCLVGKVFCILTKSWKAKKILPKFILVNKIKQQLSYIVFNISFLIGQMPTVDFKNQHDLHIYIS